MYSCILLVRKDLQMSKGKIIAQCGHGIVYSMMNTSKEKIELWQNSGEKIVTLGVKDEKTMMYIHNKALNNTILSYIVKDAGHTQVAPNTKTVCILGPHNEDRLQKLVKDLKLL